MNLKQILALATLAASLAYADDQTKVGAGNAASEMTGHASPLVRSAHERLVANVSAIQNGRLRSITLDAINNPNTCVLHRAHLTGDIKKQIVTELLTASLVNPTDAATIQGGVEAGVFPPVLNDGSDCPMIPMDFYAAPGSTTGSHHSYPGGLSVHEAFNQQSSMNFAASYRGEYGQPNAKGLPVDRGLAEADDSDVRINQDIIVAAPAWHDWAKTMVMQWNADGTEFVELNFGGAGLTDNNGATGDSRTGGHHIIGLAETMARRLSPLLVITQACAHSAPTLGNEYKVVNWLRAAAIIAQVDPVSRGYLTIDALGHYRLPPLKELGSVDLLANGQSNLLIEYQIHNLSDADFVNSIPAIGISQVILETIAGTFGYVPTDAATYNTRYRNVVLSYFGGERLEMIYGHSGLPGVYDEVMKLRALGLL